jgi:hypothetical protein
MAKQKTIVASFRCLYSVLFFFSPLKAVRALAEVGSINEYLIKWQTPFQKAL